MDAVRQPDNTQSTKGGPNPGLLRLPITFLHVILLGIALHWVWPLRFKSPTLRLLGPLVTVCALSARLP